MKSEERNSIIQKKTKSQTITINLSRDKKEGRRVVKKNSGSQTHSQIKKQEPPRNRKKETLQFRKKQKAKQLSPILVEIKKKKEEL
ncbi:13458_t:CDS:2 [Dentiscutata erythropus]|uniref:13458_t:CDS:1 n=1 Tax=Dentiscutata erythropus TaxID=1348616 RepID=A0A9N9NFW5_9GLOM|nr:13458_t:CDS:2 [Dentiscutata erythropus]